MGRLHLFELHDLSWFPAVLRDGMTGYLQTVSQVLRLHEAMVPVVQRAVDESGAERIVDLCSGSGGPIADIRDRLARPVELVLTDKYPNRAAFDDAEREGVTAERESVDAANVPARLTGMRTVINAFHHFGPRAARAVLGDAVAQRAPIVVLELSERRLMTVLTSPLIIPMVLVMMPRVRPTRWHYWVLTYLIPVLPLAVFWDGLVSHLRTYSPAELRELAAPFADAGYTWRAERVRAGAGLNITTLVGIPTSG